LQLPLFEVGGIPQGLAGLPVDNLETAVLFVHGVDFADHDAPVEGQVDLALDLYRAPRGPRRRREGGLERLELFELSTFFFGVELDAQRVDDLGRTGLPKALLNPAVKE